MRDVTSMAVAIGALVAAVALGVVAFAGWRSGLPPISWLRRLPRSSRWARFFHPDLIRLAITERGQPNRVTLGWRGPLLLAAEAGASTLVVGPTQSGKTTNVCIPAVLEWQGPVVVVTIKRDIIDQTAGWRQRKGKTLIYDPIGGTKLPSMRFSPHYGCFEFMTAWWVATTFMNGMDWGKSRGDSDYAHWADAAQRLYAVAFYAGAWLRVPMSEVRAWINDGTGESLRQALARVPNVNPIVIEIFQSIQQRPERERGSCYSTAQRGLSMFLDKRVAASAVTTDWQTDAFLKEGENTLYVIGSLGDHTKIRPLFNSLVNGILERAAEVAQATDSGRLPQPLLMVFDEAGLTATISHVADYLASGYQQGISMVMAYHDVSEIRERYEALADSIVNNMRSKLFLSGQSDRRTLQLATQLIGQEQARAYTYSSNGGPSSYQRQRRALVTPDAVRQLRPGSGLLIYHYVQPVVVGLQPWFRDPLLRQRSAIRFNPEVPASLR
jgi:type IV secretion system protein VirD4